MPTFLLGRPCRRASAVRRRWADGWGLGLHRSRKPEHRPPAQLPADQRFVGRLDAPPTGPSSAVSEPARPARNR